MTDTLFPFFIAALILFPIALGIYFSIEKQKILTSCKLPDSRELKNIYGTTVTDKGPLNWNLEFNTFDVLINDNSIFLFVKAYGFIPKRITNLLFSRSDVSHTKKPTLLREYKINHDSIQFVYYPRHLMNRSRKVTLQKLRPDEISMLEEVLNGKSRRSYDL
ncbi:hypothetical protein [Chryseobacterium geocarposphaerae]|uniref:Uncharacterized protein n=1 Tax=Chryseobacterium geocarposphaerae TaxID=1416776 RepID=A0A2M9BXZ9_9FLAO|nr:hypothetical protein [Chryseobacterium geocarposphaerae]PJJ62940.1 hypothetical protein CLV73_3457 [Chryseobacterium geocarposphaerae]